MERSDCLTNAHTDLTGGATKLGKEARFIMAFCHILCEFLTKRRNSCAASAVLAQATHAPTGIRDSSFICNKII